MQLMTKCSEYKFDFEQVQKDVLAIIDAYPGLPQIGLTHSPKAIEPLDKILESVGSIYDYETRSTKFDERDFTIFNEAYRNTSLYEMYKTIPDIGRFRIMILNGPQCYTFHTDQSMRYHYVIETNPNSMFIFPDLDKLVRIPLDGSVYKLDTIQKHSFMNGGRRRRIHIVLNDLATL